MNTFKEEAGQKLRIVTLVVDSLFKPILILKKG